jgi:hypothetical protein
MAGVLSAVAAAAAAAELGRRPGASPPSSRRVMNSYSPVTQRRSVARRLAHCPSSRHEVGRQAPAAGGGGVSHVRIWSRPAGLGEGRRRDLLSTTTSSCCTCTTALKEARSEGPDHRRAAGGRTDGGGRPRQPKSNYKALLLLGRLG